MRTSNYTRTGHLIALFTERYTGTELSLIDDPNTPPYRRLYTEDIARVFNCSTKTVNEMKARGTIPPETYRERSRDVWTVGQIRDWLVSLGKKVNQEKQEGSLYTEADLVNALMRSVAAK